jgi:hypothetical protein
MALVGGITPVKERLLYVFQALPDLLEALLHNNRGWIEIEKIRVQSAARMAFCLWVAFSLIFFSEMY